MTISCTINGEQRSFEASGAENLSFVLREVLGLPGTKAACEQGECGSCSVVLDGELVCGCLVLAADVDGSTLLTVEGLGTAEHLHPVQEAMLHHGGVQCGFCTPGFVVAAASLLENNPHPSTLEIRETLAGNVCRCTGYGAILRALEELARLP